MSTATSLVRTCSLLIPRRLLLLYHCCRFRSRVIWLLYQRAYTDSFSVIEKLELNKLRSLKSHGGVDRALLSFDLKVDLTPAFHWNIKQLFVYVVAVYETNGRFNQVALWDRIVQADDPKLIDETNVFVKYALVDHGDELRGKDVTLQLQWDHMPITGLLHMDMQPMKTASKFVLPEEYQ